MTARFALLNSSSQCIKTCLATISSNLLPAKLLIISRLVYKSLSESNDNIPPYIDTVREQLASMRRKLLDRVDENISGSTLNESELAEDLTAFSVVTSSTATNTLHHFLQARLDSILFSLSNTGSIQDCVLQALDIFFNTLKQAGLVFRSKLTESYLRLKSKPLLRDGLVCALQELNLDLYKGWLPLEIRNFIPYIRHDELQKADLDGHLSTWAEDAFRQFLAKIAAKLEEESDLKKIVKLREDVFKDCLSRGRLLPSGTIHLLENLRTLFSSRLVRLIQVKTAQLSSLCNYIKSHLMRLPQPIRQHNVHEWQSHSLKVAKTVEARQVKKYICDQSYGLDKKLSGLKQRYESWSESISAIFIITEGMKNTQFDEYLDSMSDNQRQDLLVHQLRREDPESLQSTLSHSLINTSKTVSRRLHEIVHQITEEEVGTKSYKAAILLRYLRELRQIQTNSKPKTASALANMSSTLISAVFSQEGLIKPLHTIVAQAVVEETREIFKKALRLLEQSKRVPGRCIWDGDPPLPTQPMPQTYRFLRMLAESMISYGYDIWSPSAVMVLKQEMHFFVKMACDSFLIKHTASHKNGSKDIVDSAREPFPEQEKGPETVSTIRHNEKLIQLTFDILYLSKIFETPDLGDKWRELSSGIAEAANLGDSPALVRIDKSTLDYWKRTYLYFGLLASH